jgi:hypothetical protein
MYLINICYLNYKYKGNLNQKQSNAAVKNASPNFRYQL